MSGPPTPHRLRSQSFL